MPRKPAKKLKSQTSVRLPVETLERLQRIADAQEVNVADLIRQAIKAMFPPDKK